MRQTEETINKAGRSIYPAEKSVLGTETTRHYSRFWPSSHEVDRSDNLVRNYLRGSIRETFRIAVDYSCRSGRSHHDRPMPQDFKNV